MILHFVNRSSEAQDTTFGRINATWDQNIIILKERVRNKIITIFYFFNEKKTQPPLYEAVYKPPQGGWQGD